MKKTFTLLMAILLSVYSFNTFAQCTTAANTWTDLNLAGGAPCNDGTGCVITDPDFTSGSIGIYGSEAYLLENVQAGFDYIFDMCSGYGAGAWIPAITIVAPSGAIDAYSLGTSGTFATNCSLPWTATESGEYTIVIHKAGVACGTETFIDNGNPTVTCGTNAASCVPAGPCVAGTLSTTGFPKSICPGSSFVLNSNGAETGAGFGVYFSPQASGGGGLGGSFTLTGVTYPYTGDNDLGGLLSTNSYPLMTGQYAMYLVSYSDAANAANTVCDISMDSVMVTFLAASDPLCSGTGTTCNNGDVAASLIGTTQNVCVGESISLMTNGAEVIPAGETYGWYFQSNTNVDSFYIVTGPASYTGDLNGNLASPIPFDSYSVYGFTTDSSQTTFCGGDVTANGFTINFLSPTDPLCSVTPTCAITGITAGTQTACNSTTNTYTQSVTVTYNNAPSSGNLIVNGQSFPKTSSPQTVILTGLVSNGNAVNVTASFSANSSCTFTQNALFTAPASCQCPTINVTVTSTTPVSNCVTPNGSITVAATGGTGTYTYAWSPSTFGSGATISNLPSGTYSVVVTDGNGCTGTASGNVSNTSGVNASVGNITPVKCYGENNGAISINATGGTTPITYTWSDQAGVPTSISSKTNLTAGAYTITVADAGGCSVILGPVSIAQPDELLATVDNSSNISCNGSNDGSIDVSVTGGNGGNSFSWTNGGGTAEDASGLSAGAYKLTVTDSKGCTASSSSVAITEPAALAVALDSKNDVSCFNGNDGSILVTATGGTGTLTYSWSNSSNVEDLLNVGTGSYQLTVTDANGCSFTSASYTIAEPGFVTATISSTPTTAGASNGTATVVASGGTAPYTYKWSDANAQTTAAATGLAAGPYSCIIKDAKGCTHSVNIEVGVSDAIGEIAMKGLMIYPNPSNGLFTISFETIENLDFDIKVINTIGKVVYANTYANVNGNFTEQFDFAKFTNGIYFIELSNKNAKTVERIAISK